MKILAFETANRYCSVAFAENDKLIAFKTASAISQQSEELFGLIQEALDGEQLTNIDVIATNIGPGSFTGARIGVAAANGLKIALPQCKLCGLTTLELLSCHARNQDYVTIMSAGKNEYYYQIAGGDIVCVEQYRLDELLAAHPTHELIKYDEHHTPSASDIIQYLAIHDLESRFTDSLTPLYIKPPHITVAKLV